MKKICKTHYSMRALFWLTFAAVILINNFGYTKESNVKGKRLDWYQWRGPNRDGISYETGVLKHWPKNGPDIVWRIAVGDGYSGISVSNSKLFTMWDEGDSQFLFCLDAQTGKELWRYSVGKNFKNGWGNGPRSTPLVSKNIVYAISTEGLVHAVNIIDGKTRWTHDLKAKYGSQIPVYGYSSSPLVEGEKLFVEAGGKESYAFIALNKETGDLIWHSQTDLPSYSSPIAVTVNKTRQIVFLSAEGLYSVSPKDGSLIWHYSWNARCPSTGVPVNTTTPIFIVPNKMFISGGFGTVTGAAVVQLQERNEKFIAEKLWNSSEMKNLINSSVFFKNFMYGFDDKILKCIDVRTGKTKWETPGFKRGSLIAADGHLIVLGENGNLALVEATPEEYREIANVKILSGKCWTSPSLANGKLYLRNHEEMVCLDVAVK